MAPAPVGVESESGHSSTASVTIPSAATAGDRLFVSITARSTQATSGVGDLTLLLDGVASSSGNGKMYVYTGVVTSGGGLDPSAGLNVGMSGSAPWTIVASVWQASDVLASAINAYSGGSVSTITTPSLTSDVADARLIHFYGDISNANPPAAAVTWTAHASTTEYADVGSNSGSGRQATQLVAHEAISAAGATATRTATPSENVQGRGGAVLIGTSLDRPVATFGSSQTVGAGTTVNLTLSAENGAGAPFTYLVTHDSGPATPSISGATTTTPSFTPTVPGTYVVRAVVTDSADVDSDPAFVTVTVLGASSTARPLSDVTTTGWVKEPTSATSFAAVLADDDDATYGELEDPSASNPIRVKLQAVDQPVNNEDYTLWVRASFLDLPAGGKFTPSLMEGVTTIKTWPQFTWDFDQEVNYITFTLTAADYDAVTNWADLDVVLTPAA